MNISKSSQNISDNNDDIIEKFKKLNKQDISKGKNKKEDKKAKKTIL